jgi:hypothetical protein
MPDTVMAYSLFKNSFLSPNELIESHPKGFLGHVNALYPPFQKSILNRISKAVISRNQRK